MAAARVAHCNSNLFDESFQSIADLRYRSSNR